MCDTLLSGAVPERHRDECDILLYASTGYFTFEEIFTVSMFLAVQGRHLACKSLKLCTDITILLLKQ